MTPINQLLDQVRERAEFDVKAARDGFCATGRTRGEYIYHRGRLEEHARLLPLIDALIQAVEVSEKALKECEGFCQDSLARTNEAIATDCPDCDYQCAGCIRNVDDCEHTKKAIRLARASMQSILEKAVK